MKTKMYRLMICVLFYVSVILALSYFEKTIEGAYKKGARKVFVR